MKAGRGGVVREGGRRAGNDLRARMLAAVHAGRRALRWDEPTYRSAVAQYGNGKESAGDLSEGELGALLDRMRELGYGRADGSPAVRPSTSGARGGSERDRQIGKARELWGELAQLGAIRDGSDAGLRAFVLRQTRKSAPEWCTPREMSAVIEGLKAMRGRAAAGGES